MKLLNHFKQIDFKNHFKKYRQYRREYKSYKKVKGIYGAFLATFQNTNVPNKGNNRSFNRNKNSLKDYTPKYVYGVFHFFKDCLYLIEQKRFKD